MEENYYEEAAQKFERGNYRSSFLEDLDKVDDTERDRQAAIEKKYIRESSGKKKRRKKRKKKSEKNQYLLIAAIIVIVAIVFCLALALIIETEDIDVYSPSDMDITYLEQIDY